VVWLCLTMRTTYTTSVVYPIIGSYQWLVMVQAYSAPEYKRSIAERLPPFEQRTLRLTLGTGRPSRGT
jgi:hypothetical protein